MIFCSKHSSSIKVEFFKPRLAWNKSNNSLGVGGTSIELLEELELDELETLLLMLMDELELDASLEDELSLEDKLETLEVVSLEELESLLPLLLKGEFEQAVSTNNAIKGNSFFIFTIYIKRQVKSQLIGL